MSFAKYAPLISAAMGLALAGCASKEAPPPLTSLADRSCAPQPDLTSAKPETVVRKGIAMFEKVNVPILGIIENMSYFTAPNGERVEIFGHGGGHRTADMLGVPFLGEVPLDPRVVVGGDSGEPILVLEPASVAAQAFREIARSVVRQVESGMAGHTHDHAPDHAHAP